MTTASFDSGLRSFLFRSNTVPMFLYDGRSLRIREANDAALAKYGYSCKEFRSMTIRDLYPYGDAHVLDDALLPGPEAPSHSLRTHSTKAGKSFVVDVRAVPFLRGHRRLFLMSVADAPAWSDARFKLVRTEEIHRSLVRECPFGIYLLNLTTSRFEQANPVLSHVLGYSLEELCSINVPGLYVEPSDRERFLSELHANGNVHDFETRFRRKDGAVVRISLSLDTSAPTLSPVTNTFRVMPWTSPVNARWRSNSVIRIAWRPSVALPEVLHRTSTTSPNPSASPANWRC
jgi:PAS domain S-box-containing protein